MKRKIENVLVRQFITLDTQEMTSFDLDAKNIPLAIIYLPNANHLFVPQYDTGEIWKVSMTSSDMIFKTKPLTTSEISSICPSHDGHRLLLGSEDRTVRMWNIEYLRSSLLGHWFTHKANDPEANVEIRKLR